jgi:hypothetical protein
MGVHLMGVRFVGMPVGGVYLIYESSLRGARVARISCIDTKDVLKASDCGRLGRQAAGHPWSVLRVVKS